MYTFEDAIHALEQHGCKPTPSGSGYTAFCPVHEADHQGHTQSLSIAAGEKVPFVVHCHAGCAYADIVNALGLDTTRPSPASQPRIVATYSYCDAQGNEVSRKVRYEPKTFKQCWPDGHGGYVWKKPTAAPAVLYRLPELRAAIDRGETIWVCEGEKDCDRLVPLGFVATCNIEGAAQPNRKAKWRREYTEQLAGASRVILLPDHDEPGRAHMAAIAQALHGKVSDIRILELPGLSGAKGDNDVSDWLNKGHTLEDLQALIDAAPEAETMTAPGPEESEPPSHRPAMIQINVGELPEAADQAEAALIQHGAPIYQRSGYLCRITRLMSMTVRGITRPQGAVAIFPLDTEHLLDRMARLIHFEKWSEKKGDYARCHAPPAVAKTLLARSGEWAFPVLNGVVSAPTLRPDGSLLDQPGYDPATGLLFDPQGVRFPAISASPTRTQAETALAFLFHEVLSGFPFAQPSDRAAALSAILTALIRPMLKAAPLHTVDAPHAGSGKSLLADVVSLIATGTPATVMSFSDDPDEMRKRILSILLQGDAVINLDNMAEPLQGDSLCSVLTQETFTDRLLGVNRTATAPTTCTWLATGNNLQVIGDMTRRFIPCRLDAGLEHPEEREFNRNLYDWIPANRPALVVAGLTALRAYIVAGKPKQPIKTLGSFEDWSGLVRSALIWLGEADPNIGRAEFENADPKRNQLRNLLLAWYGAFRSAGATSKEAVTKASETRINEEGAEERCYPALWDALNDHFQDRGGKLRPQLIGEFIKKNKNRVEIGARFEEWGVSHQAIVWRLVIIDQNRFQKFYNDGQQPPQGPQTPQPTTKKRESGDPREPSNRHPENFGSTKNEMNDADVLVHHLLNGSRGLETQTLRTRLNWSEERWQKFSSEGESTAPTAQTAKPAQPENLQSVQSVQSATPQSENFADKNWEEF